jgi:hypothetical protein
LEYYVADVDGKETGELSKKCNHALSFRFGPECRKLRLFQLPLDQGQEAPVTENIVPADKIRLLGGLMPHDTKPKRGAPWKHKIDIPHWVEDHLPGCRVIESRQVMGGQAFWLSRCPFHHDEASAIAYIFQPGEGRILFKCVHESCHARAWDDLQKEFDPRKDYRNPKYRLAEEAEYGNTDGLPILDTPADERQDSSSEQGGTLETPLREMTENLTEIEIESSRDTISTGNYSDEKLRSSGARGQLCSVIAETVREVMLDVMPQIVMSCLAELERNRQSQRRSPAQANYLENAGFIGKLYTIFGEEVFSLQDIAGKIESSECGISETLAEKLMNSDPKGINVRLGMFFRNALKESLAFPTDIGEIRLISRGIRGHTKATLWSLKLTEPGGADNGGMDATSADEIPRTD